MDGVTAPAFIHFKAYRKQKFICNIENVSIVSKPTITIQLCKLQGRIHRLTKDLQFRTIAFEYLLSVDSMRY